ncbi:hypothetical protein GCU56_19440 [Geodermatophilus sabuli]|uniref:SRPBCC family protein n=2 Tax=Geodermatophilus sabuli TaxID=1564158 RepID=A0A7K3W6M8_9ACTN|nr:hypothetical protein [Geodermatophilus sabuli]
MALPVLFPFRSRDTARVSHRRFPHGRRRVTIDHEPLAGVTPSELMDWFGSIGQTMEYGGEVVPRYLAWHPLDHVRWELARPAPGGGAAEGARFRIVEQFAGRPDHRIDVVDRVEKLDETGIRLVQRVAGIVVLQLEHTWSAGRDRTHYVSVLDLGARSPWLSGVNRLLQRRFPDPMVDAWITHNIEEVGLLEHLIPRLRPARTDSPSAARQAG